VNKTLGRKPSTIERASSQYEEHPEQPLPLRSLLTRPVVISIANYGTLALLEIAASVLMPLVWSTAVDLGGLGLSPASIGLWMSAYGCVGAVSQFAFFPHVVARFGPGRLVFASVGAFGLIYALFPFENLLARGTETVAAVWPLIVLQLVSMALSDMGFSECFLPQSLTDPMLTVLARQARCSCLFLPPRRTSVPSAL
jgi:hypothetical protein